MAKEQVLGCKPASRLAQLNEEDSERAQDCDHRRQSCADSAYDANRDPDEFSERTAEEALYDIQSMRAFCSLELGHDPIPDETTILNFRHLLEAHELTKTVFEAVADHLEARGALLRGGTIVDATLIARWVKKLMQ